MVCLHRLIRSDEYRRCVGQSKRHHLKLIVDFVAYLSVVLNAVFGNVFLSNYDVVVCADKPILSKLVQFTVIDTHPKRSIFLFDKQDRGSPGCSTWDQVDLEFDLSYWRQSRKVLRKDLQKVLYDRHVLKSLLL
ncbi:hypothetical protein Tco_0669730 [Tanacetum coccineum]